LQVKLKDKLYFAEPDNPAQLIQNLLGFPAAVERYKNQ
jgi:hypothetical protein